MTRPRHGGGGYRVTPMNAAPDEEKYDHVLPGRPASCGEHAMRGPCA